MEGVSKSNSYIQSVPGSSSPVTLNGIWWVLKVDGWTLLFADVCSNACLLLFGVRFELIVRLCYQFMFRPADLHFCSAHKASLLSEKRLFQSHSRLPLFYPTPPDNICVNWNSFAELRYFTLLSYFLHVERKRPCQFFFSFLGFLGWARCLNLRISEK